MMVRATGNLDAKQTPPAYVHVGRLDLLRFTVDDVDALLRAGVVPEDATVELLDGLLVRKDRAATGGDLAMIGVDHRVCVERLSDLRISINSPDRHVASQQPLQCGVDQLPEPDFAIYRGTISEYASRYPAAAEAYCVVEVADSSYERDTGEKLAAYARAGIVQYVVINLRNRTAEVYETPNVSARTYAAPVIIPSDGTLRLRIGDSETMPIRLADILP